jgi:sodium pump decarboxylase gamma subunit
MELIAQSMQVSLLAMGVIFLVLGILIVVIRVMVHFVPYSAPPAPAAKAAQAPAAASGSSQDEDHIAAIHAALAHHLGKSPQDIHIANISPL